MNKEAIRDGMQVTSQITEKAQSYYEVSNFGNETKLGSSEFQQQAKEVVKQGEANVARSMKAALDVSRVSQFGNQTSLGHSRFQQSNAQISNYTPKVPAGGHVDIAE